jgi:hypothetical protein
VEPRERDMLQDFVSTCAGIVFMSSLRFFREKQMICDFSTRPQMPKGFMLRLGKTKKRLLDVVVHGEIET